MPKFKFNLQRPLSLVAGGIGANMVNNLIQQNVPQAQTMPYLAPGITFLAGMYLDQMAPGKGKTKELVKHIGQGMLVSGGIDLANALIPGVENLLGDVIANPFMRTDRTLPYEGGRLTA